MRIGIITFHNVINYGAALQALATQTVLTNIGHEASIINYTPDHICCIYKPFSLAKYRLHAKNSLSVLARSIASDLRHFRRINKKRARFNAFFKKYYNLDFTQKKTLATLEKALPQYDACITGSDQVWNPDITGGFDPAYFLRFGDEKMIRLSYAASIGRDNYTEKEYEELSSLVRGLDAVSVREESAEKLLRDKIGLDSETVLDPTLILTANEWIDLVGDEDTVGQPYIFVYTLYPNAELDKYVEHLSREKNLPVVTINPRSSYYNELTPRSYADPADFVRLIRGASYVVTNSFHGTAFSVNFSKNVTTFKGGARNSRITDLLSKLGLGDRAVSTYEEALRNSTDIEAYPEAQKRLSEAREHSISFINKALRRDC